MPAQFCASFCTHIFLSFSWIRRSIVSAGLLFYNTLKFPGSKYQERRKYAICIVQVFPCKPWLVSNDLLYPTLYPIAKKSTQGIKFILNLIPNRKKAQTGDNKSRSGHQTPNSKLQTANRGSRKNRPRRNFPRERRKRPDFSAGIVFTLHFFPSGKNSL